VSRGSCAIDPDKRLTYHVPYTKVMLSNVCYHFHYLIVS